MSLFRLVLLALALVSTSGLRVSAATTRVASRAAAAQMKLPAVDDARNLSTDEIEKEITNAKKVRVSLCSRFSLHSRAVNSIHRTHLAPPVLPSPRWLARLADSSPPLRAVSGTLRAAEKGEDAAAGAGCSISNSRPTPCFHAATHLCIPVPRSPGEAAPVHTHEAPHWPAAHAALAACRLKHAANGGSRLGIPIMFMSYGVGYGKFCCEAACIVPSA